MKCYTFERGAVTLGIQLTMGRYGLGVLLGQNGPRSRYEMALLGANHAAPEIQDGKVIEAFPLWKDDRLWLVAADNQADDRALLRVNTQGVRAYRRGSWGTIRGCPKMYLHGWGCHPKDDPETSSWDDGLVVLHPGDVLEVRRQGYESYVVALEESGVVCLLLKRYQQQQQATPAPVTLVATAS